MVDERLKNILTRNGLSEKQALVFLACLEGGQMTISQVATLANLKRSITYKVVESLIKDGYLSEIFGEKVRIFQANDPIRILRTVENNTDDLKFFIPILKGIFQKHDLKPKVEFYDGKDGIRAIFRTFGLAKKAKFISSYSLLFKEFPEDIEHWIRSAQKQRTRVQIRQLVSNEPEGRRFAGEVLSSPAWNIRILPKEFGVKIDFGIVDERIVALASFDPVFIVLVHSESIADFFSSFFELIWKNSKKIRKKK